MAAPDPGTTLLPLTATVDALTDSFYIQDVRPGAAGESAAGVTVSAPDASGARLVTVDLTSLGGDQTRLLFRFLASSDVSQLNGSMAVSDVFIAAPAGGTTGGGTVGGQTSGGTGAGASGGSTGTLDGETTGNTTTGGGTTAGGGVLSGSTGNSSSGAGEGGATSTGTTGETTTTGGQGSTALPGSAGETTSTTETSHGTSGAGATATGTTALPSGGASATTTVTAPAAGASPGVTTTTTATALATGTVGGVAGGAVATGSATASSTTTANATAGAEGGLAFGLTPASGGATTTGSVAATTSAVAATASAAATPGGTGRADLGGGDGIPDAMGDGDFWPWVNSTDARPEVAVEAEAPTPAQVLAASRLAEKGVYLDFPAPDGLVELTDLDALHAAFGALNGDGGPAGSAALDDAFAGFGTAGETMGAEADGPGGAAVALGVAAGLAWLAVPPREARRQDEELKQEL